MTRVIKFDRVASIYDQTRTIPSNILKEAIQQVRTIIKPINKPLLLDVGCGTGRIMIPFTDIIDSHSVGIDVSRKMLEELHKKTRINQKKHIEIIFADLNYTPFRLNLYSIIMNVHVLHLVSEWKDALSNLAQLIRSQGYLITMGKDAKTGRTKCYAQYEKLIQKHGIKRKSVGTRSFTEIENHLTKLGFKTDRIRKRYKDLENVSTAYQNLTNTVYSSQWDINPEIHKKIMRELKTYIDEYIGMNKVEETKQIIKILVSRK